MQRFADKTTYEQFRDISKYGGRTLRQIGEGVGAFSKSLQIVTTGASAAGYRASKAGLKKTRIWSKESYENYLKNKPRFMDETRKSLTQMQKNAAFTKDVMKSYSPIGPALINGTMYSNQQAKMLMAAGAFETAKSGVGALWHSPIGNAAKTAGLSMGLYGLMGFLEDNKMDNASDRMITYGKNLTAGVVDTTSDLAMTGIGVAAESAGIALAGMTGWTGLAMAGTGVGVALTAYSLLGNLFGIDPGSLVKKGLDQADEMYETAKYGPKFDMTRNTSMAMQRQLQNLHASGSNMAEMLHN